MNIYKSYFVIHIANSISFIVYASVSIKSFFLLVTFSYIFAHLVLDYCISLKGVDLVLELRRQSQKVREDGGCLAQRAWLPRTKPPLLLAVHMAFLGCRAGSCCRPTLGVSSASWW